MLESGALNYCLSTLTALLDFWKTLAPEEVCSFVCCTVCYCVCYCVFVIMLNIIRFVILYL